MPVKDDPKKPVKAIIAFLSSLCALLITLNLDLPPWAVVLLTVVATTGGVYAAPNPKKQVRHR